MSKDAYSKYEIDLLFQRLELVVKGALGPLENKIDNVATQVEGILKANTDLSDRVDVHDTAITSIKSGYRGALWALGLTIPLLLGLVVWIFFNEVTHMRETLPLSLNYLL